MPSSSMDKRNSVPTTTFSNHHTFVSFGQGRGDVVLDVAQLE